MRLCFVGALLNADDRARYHREGLLVITDQFSASEIAALRQAFDRLRALSRGLSKTAEACGARFVLSPDDRVALQRIVWCGAAEPALAALGTDPRILDRAAALLQETVVDQLINQAHFKEPGDGVDFPLHQDAWNRRFGTPLWTDTSPDGGFVQVVLTIDPMTELNGPLMYVPGSHRLGPVLGDERRKRVDAVAAETLPVPVVADPGALIFFGPFLVHGSTPNRSSVSRRVVVNGFARQGVNRRRYHGAGLGVRRVISSRDEDSARRTVEAGISPQLGA